jgi:hypothetical protein
MSHHWFRSVFTARGALSLFTRSFKADESPWPESASQLYRPSTTLVPTFADSVCHVVSVMNPYGPNLVFLDRSRYILFQVAPQLYSRG